MDVATQIAQKAVATKGREKKTTCAEIVLKGGGDSGGRKKTCVEIAQQVAATQEAKQTTRGQIAQKVVATRGREKKISV